VRNPTLRALRRTAWGAKDVRLQPEVVGPAVTHAVRPADQPGQVSVCAVSLVTTSSGASLAVVVSVVFS